MLTSPLFYVPLRKEKNLSNKPGHTLGYTMHLVSEMLNLKNVYLEINDSVLYLHISSLGG